MSALTVPMLLEVLGWQGGWLVLGGLGLAASLLALPALLRAPLPAEQSAARASPSSAATCPTVRMEFARDSRSRSPFWSLRRSAGLALHVAAPNAATNCFGSNNSSGLFMEATLQHRASRLAHAYKPCPQPQHEPAGCCSTNFYCD
jgi:hypothetical protein